MNEDSIRILLVEDEFITLETLTTVLCEMNYTISGDAMSAKEAIDILDKGETDLAILDIHIKGSRDGIWLAKQINEKYKIPYIFLTAFGDEFTVKRAIAAEPYGYLVKPFNKVDIFTAIEVALKNYAKQVIAEDTGPDGHTPDNRHILANDYVFIRDNYAFVKLKISEILFIKSDKNYLEIYIPGKKHVVRGKLNDFADNLLPEQFISVHRSYVVNLDVIDKIVASHLSIGNVDVPIGANYKDDLKKRLTIF
jgi:DNA-binding LytR/AlgR family response regulator